VGQPAEKERYAIGLDGAALTRTMTDEHQPDLPDREDEEPYEEFTYFVGCTCEHPTDEHAWGECLAPGCDCEGGWQE
jgi:hypothetical protein